LKSEILEMKLDSLMTTAYSSTVLDHFKNPRNAGPLPGATLTVEVTNPVCGDLMRLSAIIADGRITAARFQTQGCVAAIAAGSVLTEMLAGISLDDAAASISPQKIADALGGLPPATFHGAQLAADAASALKKNLTK
jgi:NifU-like protein involved in Fe-S cluster formation